MEKYAVIMAGGTGSRLWPLSRECKPKQFISIENNQCMLLQTIDRISAIVPPEKCFIITTTNLLDITQKTLEDMIPPSNIIIEPIRKNTAACISYASLAIKERYGRGILCFVPADGYVKNQNDYRAALRLAYQTAEHAKDLVIIGITPSYPATGYGYIHLGEKRAEGVYKIRRFIEKPELKTAIKLLAAQESLWNSGILLGNVETIIDSVKQFLPDHFEKISRAVMQTDKQDFALRLEEAYREISDISFDTGVLEKCGGINVVKGDFDWDDIGSLDALAKTFPADAEGNLVQGDHFGIDTNNSIIYSKDIPVTTIGVKNMIIAVTNDTALICPKDSAQNIKSLVGQLKNSGFSYLT
ncbi:MAG: nucleotidyl transferase [Clostridia bacterium]|nr:nucleotidyl transferase [Clostridia bacterium]